MAGSANAAMAAGQQGLASRLQAGVVTGLMATIFAISHATLVTGAVAPFATATVIGMALIGTAVLCFTLGFLSGVKGLVPLTQDVPSAAIGAILVSVVIARSGDAGTLTSAEVVILCLIAGFAFSVSQFLFGTLRLSMLMRFAPRPVLAGFLAGTGYFMVIGAIGICLNGTVTWAALPELAQMPALPKLFVTLAVAAGLFLANRHLPPNYAVGGTICLAVVLFHIGAGLLGVDLATLGAQGWTAALPAGGLPWPPIAVADLQQVDIGFVAQQVFPLCTMIVLATTALLMNTSALEAKTRVDLKLDWELKALGLSNLAATVLGGLPGYHGVVTSLAGMRIAAPSRMVSAFAGIFVLMIFVLGDKILAVLPLPVFGGFMLWVGIDFLREWLVRETRVTPIKEAWLTGAIFLVIVGFGLFEGTVFGLAAGAVLFIIDYSRQNPVRTELSGDVFHGATERSPAQLRVLGEHGAAIRVLKLEGYVFFGTAYRLRERIGEILASGKITYLVIDFEGVAGIDATAIGSFGRIADDLESAEVTAVLSGMSQGVARIFQRAEFSVGPTQVFDTARDLNEGLTRFEEKVLQQHKAGTAPAAQITAILRDVLGDAALADRLAPYLERCDLEQGAVFVTEGAQAADVFFLEQGGAEVVIGTGDAARRVRSLTPGAIIGEIAFLCGGVRTSTVRTTQATVLWRFSAATADTVLREDPDLSSRFYSGLARILAERVSANTRLIQMLQA